MVISKDEIWCSGGGFSGSGERIGIYNYAFRLPFLQTAYFLQASEMMKSLTYVRFSSESYRKYRRCFQQVDGEMNNYKFIFAGTLV